MLLYIGTPFKAQVSTIGTWTLWGQWPDIEEAGAVVALVSDAESQAGLKTGSPHSPPGSV